MTQSQELADGMSDAHEEDETARRRPYELENKLRSY